MLYTVTQLSQDILWDIGRTLCDEIDTHTLRANQSDDLFYLVEQGLTGAVEEHMGLIEEEHELGQGQVAHFRQGGVELRQQPQQEGGVEFGLHHQLVGCQYAHHTFAAFRLQQVIDFERRFAEELVGPLVL